jgi:Mycobacterium membrane protein
MLHSVQPIFTRGDHGMTESDLPDPTGRPARRWPVIVGSVLLVTGALALALWVARPDDPPAVVVYEVSGDAPSATVVYSTFTAEGTKAEELTSLPWRARLTVAGGAESGVLNVTIGPEGGAVGCRVTVNGVERRSATATGAQTRALCDWSPARQAGLD